MTPAKHQPFVPDNVEMKEFTWRAVLLGLAMTVVLGSANAYLGLRAGQTIAATYPAAVIGMAVLRLGRGTILEENIARTAGSIGEGVAAGAVFTVPAVVVGEAGAVFVMAKAWPSFGFADAYWKSTALILVGSVLGVLFVSLVRRVLVEDPELPFPESLAASQIHKAGQVGAQAAKYLFYNMGFGAATFLLGAFNVFAPDKDFFFPVGRLGTSTLKLGGADTNQVLGAGGIATCSAPTVSPAFLGVGYVIGPELASLNFAGSVIAWGLLIPLLIFFLGPQLQNYLPPGPGSEAGWLDEANAVWRYIVRPIAVGGMMVGTGYTLFRMRKNLFSGLAKAFAEVRTGGPDLESMNRTERYMSSKTVLGLLAVTFVAMTVLYIYLSKLVAGGTAAAIRVFV